MTHKQKLLAFVVGVAASAMFQWPAGILIIWGAAELNGDVPTKQPAK